MRKINFHVVTIQAKKERRTGTLRLVVGKQLASPACCRPPVCRLRVAAAMTQMQFLDLSERPTHALGLPPEDSIHGRLRGTQFSSDLQLRPIGSLLNFFDEERDIFIHGRNYTRMDRQCNTRMDRSLYSPIRARIVAR